jgi:hypothetical protein
MYRLQALFERDRLGQDITFFQYSSNVPKKKTPNRYCWIFFLGLLPEFISLSTGRRVSQSTSQTTVEFHAKISDSNNISMAIWRVAIGGSMNLM